MFSMWIQRKRRILGFKFIILSLICITLFSLFISAFAHSGGTDSNGGHYESATGTYHYHHGKPEHQHTNGECPYDSYLRYIWPFLLIIGGIFVLFMWWWISTSLPHKVISNFEYAIHNYKNAKQHADFCNKALKEIEEKAIIPDGYEIGKHRLPKEINSANWGESLTVYTVIDGWKLHLQKDCCGSFAVTRNVYDFYNKRYSLCKKCATNYQPPNMDWYSEYLKIDYKQKQCEVAKQDQNKNLKRLQICYDDCNAKLARFFLFFSPSKKNKLNELKKEYAQAIQ